MNDKSASFSIGDRVRHVPPEANGDAEHPASAVGIVHSVDSENVLVRFGSKVIQACAPQDLIKLPEFGN